MPMRWWSLSRCVVLACSVLAAGCGELPPAREAPSTGPREFFPLELPYARDTEMDRANAGSMYTPEDEGGPVFVLNATRDGLVYFRQYEFDLVAEDVEPAEVDAALRETIGRACRQGRETDARGPVILIHADRGAAWGVLRRVLKATSESGCAAQQLRIVCRSTERTHVRRVLYDVVPESTASETAVTMLGVLPIHVAQAAAPRVSVRYQRGGDGTTAHSLEAIPDDPRTEGLPAVPEEIARAWHADVPRARLQVEDATPFQYVLFVLDGMRGGGAEAITLDGAGFTIRAREHAVDAPFDPTPHRPLDLVGALAIVGLCLLAAVLVWRGRRRIR